ncbi:MAG: PIN domain-containing protein [Hyphomicrobium sp.]|nr:PIN domain-containing protein [Hyphomicrobium sp.]
MTFLVDTSALIHLLRDKTGRVAERYDQLVKGAPVALSRMTEFELLNGARDEKELSRLRKLLAGETLIDIPATAWNESAQIVFDLRRRGTTLMNVFDCLIAYTAIQHDLELIHDDTDFERIAEVRPLQLHRFRSKK